MTVTIADLTDWVGASSVSGTLLTAMLADAETLVHEYLGSAGLRSCPERTVDLATLTLASELFSRRNSPGGLASWGPDGQVVRLARDPMAAVKPLLQQYRGLGPVG